MFGIAILAGRVVNEPRTYMSNGKEYAAFRLAVNHLGSETASFLEMRAGGLLVEECKALRKGDVVAFTCHVHHRLIEYRGVQWIDPSRRGQKVKQPDVTFWVTEIHHRGLGVNAQFVSGVLTSDVELRYTANGTPVATGFIEVLYGSGQHTTTSNLRYVAWNRTATAMHTHKSKGDPVIIFGRYRQREYEHEGVKRHVHELVATHVIFIPRSVLAEDEHPEPVPPSGDSGVEEPSSYAQNDSGDPGGVGTDSQQAIDFDPSLMELFGGLARRS